MKTQGFCVFESHVISYGSYKLAMVVKGRGLSGVVNVHGRKRIIFDVRVLDTSKYSYSTQISSFNSSRILFAVPKREFWFGFYEMGLGLSFHIMIGRDT